MTFLDSKMPCFRYPETVAREVEARLSVPNLPEGTNRFELIELADRLTKASLNSYWTSNYDNFQNYTNGINI